MDVQEGQGCSTRGRLFGELGASVFVVRLTLEAERKSPSSEYLVLKACPFASLPNDQGIME